MSRYDTIIIGGGVTALVAGIALLESGRSVALISSGRSNLGYFSGSFELFAEGYEGLCRVAEESNSNHPYKIIGAQNIGRYTRRIKEIFASAGLPLRGSAESVEWRLTPVGVLKAAWLTMQPFATFEQRDEIPYRKVCIVGVEGYLDFNPEFVARPFRKWGVECHALRLPAQQMCGGGCGSNSVRLFGDMESAVDFAKRVAVAAEDSDLVLLPALFDLYHSEIYEQVKRVIGERLRLVPTTSVSAAGRSVSEALGERFVTLGGVVVENDKVLSLQLHDSAARSVTTGKGGKFEADNFILSTGSFLSGGLVATSRSVYEPLAGLDVEAPLLRSEWSKEHILSAQPFERIGVRVDESLHPFKEGTPITNLYAAGAILAGYDGVGEGSGGGVALCSALRAAEVITR